MRFCQDRKQWWILLLPACWALWSLPVSAQPAPAAPPGATAPPAQKPLAESLTGEAKDAYELGKQLYNGAKKRQSRGEDGAPDEDQREDYRVASEQFRRAYELSGDARLHWNVAACEGRLRHYARVVTALERLRREGGVTEEIRVMADALETASRARTGAVTIWVSEPGAEVLVDDDGVGVTPIAAPVLIDAGAHRIRVRKRGFVEEVRTEEIQGGTEPTIRVRLVREQREGRLVIVTAPGARISLDGKIVGSGRWTGTVPSGHHRLAVTAFGSIPHHRDVIVRDSQVRTIQIDLRPAEDRRSGVPAWLWIAGGVALAAGAVTAGALLLQPEPAAPIQGSVGTTTASFGGRR